MIILVHHSLHTKHCLAACRHGTCHVIDLSTTSVCGGINCLLSSKTDAAMILSWWAAMKYTFITLFLDTFLMLRFYCGE